MLVCKTCISMYIGHDKSLLLCNAVATNVHTHVHVHLKYMHVMHAANGLVPRPY